MDDDAPARAKVMEHWPASERADSAAEHAIYATGAILDYPQSGGQRWPSRCRTTVQADADDREPAR